MDLDLLPDRYKEAYKLWMLELHSITNPDDMKKCFDYFSLRYTMLPKLWIERIKLELVSVPDRSKSSTYEECLKLKKKALKQFYHCHYFGHNPEQMNACIEREKPRKLYKVYEMPFVEVIAAVSDVKHDSPYDAAFRMFITKKSEKFLIFPHSQIRQYYRHYQRNSGTPLPADIKEKYDAAVSKYEEMIAIAMDPDEWIKWMKSAFEAPNWSANFECKIGEHPFMNEIWLAYIEYLESENRIKVLNVYKRYCRFFLEDDLMKLKYSDAILSFQQQGYNVTPWIIDQAQYDIDFSLKEDKKLLKSLLIKHASSICHDCFNPMNMAYFDGELDYQIQNIHFWRLFNDGRKRVIDSCILCDDNSYTDDGHLIYRFGGTKKDNPFTISIAAVKESAVIKFQPHLSISFINSLAPPIPPPIFQYMIDNADHPTLSKLCSTSKYFFAKKFILLCYRISVDKTQPQSFMLKALLTNAKAIIESPIKIFCCGTTLKFENSSSRKCLSKVLGKLCCCSLTNLIICHQNITVNEFKRLISAGKLEQLKLTEVRIYKDNRKLLKIEEIIALVPTVTDLSISSKSRRLFTQQTMGNLVKLDQNGKKFESFRLYQIPDSLQLGWLEKFLQIYMLPRAHLQLKLCDNVNEDFRSQFKAFMSAVQRFWYPRYEGPLFGGYD